MQKASSYIHNIGILHLYVKHKFGSDEATGTYRDTEHWGMCPVH